MGRYTKATREGFQEKLNTLRSEYKDALRDKGRREAFDKLVSAWSSELGAFTYAESITLMDLILLTSVVDNRSELEKLIKRINKLGDEGEAGSSP